jgi:hypothetical protein
MKIIQQHTARFRVNNTFNNGTIKMGIIQIINEDANDIDRLVSYWKKEGKDMEPQDLHNAVADDLEQLEYSPEQIEKLLPGIIVKIHQ